MLCYQVTHFVYVDCNEVETGLTHEMRVYEMNEHEAHLLRGEKEDVERAVAEKADLYDGKCVHRESLGCVFDLSRETNVLIVLVGFKVFSVATLGAMLARERNRVVNLVGDKDIEEVFVGEN